MKANWKPSISLGYAFLAMVMLATGEEVKPKNAEVNVRAVLREAWVTDVADKVAEQMHLDHSAILSTSFNDLEPPSVDFRAFTVSFTLDDAKGKRRNYVGEVARNIASALKDVGATGSNLDSYLGPNTPQVSEPRLIYSRGNIQGFVNIHMSNTKGKTEGVSIVCYEHVLAQSGIAEQGGADQPTTTRELKSESKDKPQPESKVAPR